MRCRDVEHLLIPYLKGADIPEDARSHFAACERCRDLAAALRAQQPAMAPSPERLDEIKSTILSNLKSVKPLVSASVLVPGLLLVVAGITTAGVIELGIAGWQVLSVAQKIAVFTSLAGACIFLAALLSRQVVPGSRVLVPAQTAVIVLLGIMAGIFAALFHPHPEATFVRTGLVCLRIGLEGAIPAAALSWLILRRGAILRPVATGALTGTLAGFSGLAILEIFCPNPNIYHILLWHLGSTLASLIGGTVIGIIAEYSSWRLSRARPSAPGN